MSTRSLTIIHDVEMDERICVMYRQMDGYPSGHGQDLKDWGEHIHIVNGIGMTETRQIANGMECLAAQMIAHFKQGVGGIYLYPISTEDAGQDYEYHLSCGADKQLNLKVIQVYGGWAISQKTLYEGPLREFDADAAEVRASKRLDNAV